jgi:N-acetylglucosamine-6-phosphate deacetylase
LTQAGLCSLGEAWEMASVRPSALMGLPVAAGLTAGAPADVVLLEQAGSRIEIVQTIKDGMAVYEAKQAAGGKRTC